MVNVMLSIIIALKIIILTLLTFDTAQCVTTLNKNNNDFNEMGK